MSHPHAETSELPTLPTPEAAPTGFEALGLDPRIRRALVDLGFENPTPIQQKAIAPLLAGRDVIGRARTGTGKTAAFGLPLLARLAPPEGGGTARTVTPRALVLAPTRELALQVSEAIQSFGKFLNLRVATLYGGASYGPQLRALRDGVHIVVGTPGRLIDHLERETLSLRDVEIVVLDEADEMLRMGFIEDVERLMGATPATRQVALFSATMPDAIRRVADAYLKEPVTVQDESGPTQVKAINQQWIYVPQRFKGEALLRLLRGEPRGTTLVFSRTKSGAAEAADALGRHGFQVEALHGDLSQAARERVLDLFRAKRLDVVVATDVAARGLDIDHITHVVNFDLPENAEVYTHRVGRTGRAGRTGTAITLVTPSQIRGWRFMTRALRTDVKESTLPTDADIAARQRDALAGDLSEVLGAPRVEVARTWAAAIMQARGWSEADLLAYAVTRLLDERGVILEADPSNEPETWGQPAAPRPPQEREQRPMRGPGDRGGYQGDRGGYQGDRGGYQGDRGGYQGDRGGSAGPMRGPGEAGPPPWPGRQGVPRDAAPQGRAPQAERPAPRGRMGDDVGASQSPRSATRERPFNEVFDDSWPPPAAAAPKRTQAPASFEGAPASAEGRPVRAPLPPRETGAARRQDDRGQDPRAEAPVKRAPARAAGEGLPERAPARTAEAHQALPEEAASAPGKRRKASDEVELSLPVGKQHGVTPADVFGAFSHEAGLTREEIGRIAVHDRVSVVRLPRPVADAVCGRYEALHLRGKKVVLIPPAPPGLGALPVKKGLRVVEEGLRAPKRKA